MRELDLTKAINNLIDGKAKETEQKICGIVLKDDYQKNLFGKYQEHSTIHIVLNAI